MSLRWVVLTFFVLGLSPYAEAQDQMTAQMQAGETGASFPTTLLTQSPEDGFALALRLSRLAVQATQPDTEVLHQLRAQYAEDADSLIEVSEVVAIHFQTIAAANDYWRATTEPESR